MQYDLLLHSLPYLRSPCGLLRPFRRRRSWFEPFTVHGIRSARDSDHAWRPPSLNGLPVVLGGCAFAIANAVPCISWGFIAVARSALRLPGGGRRIWRRGIRGPYVLSRGSPPDSTRVRYCRRLTRSWLSSPKKRLGLQEHNEYNHFWVGYERLH